MNLLSLISRLKKSGITIELEEEDKLKLRAPEGSLTPEILSELKENKSALIEFLQKHQRKRKSYIPIEPSEEKEFYVLSSAQKRMYLLQRMTPDSISYNMPYILLLEGDMDLENLERAFKTSISRHETLRTSIRLMDKEPVQQVEEDVNFEIEYCEVEELEVVGMTKKFIQPFDLAKAPLLRVKLIKTGIERYILMVDMHHIVSDGFSHGILIDEFGKLYRGEDLLALKIQYKDYSEWQNRDSGCERLRSQESYWLKQFDGEIPLLALPADFERPAVPGYEGNRLSFEMDSKDTAILKKYALEKGTTFFVVLVAIFNIFLSKICDQEDIVIGTPIAGRKHVDLHQIIGMFINTLPLRNRLRGGMKFDEFLEAVKINTMEAFENQDYQFDDLVERVGAAAWETNRNPLFDVFFVLQNIDLPRGDIAGLKLSPYRYENKTSKFDLSLMAGESEAGITFEFEYSTQLFKEETIERFIKYFKEILSYAAENRNVRLQDINITHQLLSAAPKVLEKGFNF